MENNSFFRINLGIHNHGPGDALYDTVEKVSRALRGRHPRIGACVDTGHYIRSDEDPVEAVRRFGMRVYGVHLKDVAVGQNGEKHFTEIGKGKLDTLALLRALKASHYARRGIEWLGVFVLLELEGALHELGPDRQSRFGAFQIELAIVVKPYPNYAQ